MAKTAQKLMHHYESEFSIGPASLPQAEAVDLEVLRTIKVAGGDFGRIFKRMQDREKRVTDYSEGIRTLNRAGESTPTLTRMGSSMHGGAGANSMYRLLQKSASKVAASSIMNRDSTVASIHQTTISLGN